MSESGFGLHLSFWVALAGVLPCLLSFAQPIPYEPGRYSWRVDGGEINLVTARYSNRSSFYERAYTFYFEPKGEKQAFIVPVIAGKPGDFLLTLTSASGGEWIFSDLAVQRQGNTLCLIKARQSTPNGWAEPGDLTVERYALQKGDDDDFPYRFVLQSKSVKPAVARLSVDEVLKKQLQISPR